MSGRSVKARLSGTRGLDRISPLPKHLIEDILSRLPLRDAVRTSVLSSKWREQWTTLPQIVFRESELSGEAITKAIYTIFSLHQGPVKVFKLGLVSNFPEDGDICRWIRHLSRLSINKLEIDILDSIFHNGHVPCNISHLGSCIFACQDLISLDLRCCSFRLPSNFRGLKNLKKLILKPALVAQDALENLVSSCPQLMKLDISVTPRGPSHLKISALNLQHLVVAGYLYSVKIDAPSLQHLELNCLLEDFDVNTYSLLSLRLLHYSSWNPIYEKTDAIYSCLLKLFIRQSQLKYVDLDHYFIQYLSLSGFPDTLCNSLVHLKHLTVSINFSSVEEVSATLSVLRSCPSLESIAISQELHRTEESDVYIVRKLLQDDTTSCLFKKLKNVWIRMISNNVAETSFVKFVMSRSPVLENMVITPLSDEGCFELLKQLWQCPRPNRALVFYINGRDGLREPIEEPTYSLYQTS